MSYRSFTPIPGLTLRGKTTTFFGMAISYARDNFPASVEMLKETILCRFLPFALSTDHPEFQVICLNCAIQLEAWARVIREYAGLNVYSGQSVVSAAPVLPVQNTELVTNNLVADSNVSKRVDLKKLIEELRQSNKPKEKCLEELVNIKPTNEDDWTDQQWQLWETESDSLQVEIKKARLGN